LATFFTLNFGDFFNFEFWRRFSSISCQDPPEAAPPTVVAVEAEAGAVPPEARVAGFFMVQQTKS
jgi:hypothetical protein